jgi:hypothetical protein
MVSMLLIFALAADDPPPLRLMTGNVVEVDGFTFTVANAKTRKTFRLNAETTIVYDGVRVKTREEVEIRIKDKATVTYDFESGEPKKVQITSDKRPAAKKTEEAPTEEEEAARKAELAARKAEREKEREEKAIEEERRRDEEIAKKVESGYKVRELEGGALAFGPFRTRFSEMSVKAVKRNDGRIELTMTIIDPDEMPRSFPQPTKTVARSSGVGKPAKGPAKGLKTPPTAMKTKSDLPGPPIMGPPSPETMPTGWLWLTPRFQVDGVVSSMRGGGSISQGSSTLEVPRSGKKGKAGPDDPKEIPEIADQLEKRITGDAPGQNRNKTTSTFRISLKFIVPPNIVVKPDVGLEMRFDQWIFRFNDENNAKVPAAFNEIFERFRRE